MKISRKKIKLELVEIEDSQIVENDSAVVEDNELFGGSEIEAAD
ncbi:hypothetical protein MNV_180010 [Candidatus Methanoperedens nitroreducens]|uniref:Uncharacterized protein n=1 Tax=Candidatus Methanoperedens nitratireducens TaxID=1392998 RepID=A0A284VMA1_9EURY|nr:hypothetical protein MNV_180010 [Candidatus Methanoperedens nitroreducens]